MFSMICLVDGNKTLSNKRIKEDRKWFRDKTIGHKCIMGRNTFDTFETPLKKRELFVLTHDTEIEKDGYVFLPTIDIVLDWAEADPENKEEVFVIGGADIFTQFIPYCKKIYMATQRHPASLNMPLFPWTQWTRHWRSTPYKGEILNLHIKEEPAESAALYGFTTYEFRKI